MARAGTTNGIPGVEVAFGGATAVDDANGNWAIPVNGVFTCVSDRRLTARDVDGDTYGSFQEKTVEFSATQVSDGGGS